MERLRADPELGQLQLIEAPLFDLEVRSEGGHTCCREGPVFGGLHLFAGARL